MNRNLSVFFLSAHVIVKYMASPVGKSRSIDLSTEEPEGNSKIIMSSPSLGRVVGV